ncbi:MAG: hypothetical protein MK033_01835 [Candidatus Caenarcaniphilales bacterium]|nr:hypothetical protein [Candidatus Caenarcaniphilales bacterium]
MVEDKKKELSPEQLEAQKNTLMAKAAIKTALLSFNRKQNQVPAPQLEEYWNTLSRDGWAKHLELFEANLKSYNKIKVKQLLFDLENYLKDCKKVIPRFSHKQSEILLLVALGKIQVIDFIKYMEQVPNNREKLDRDIQRQIRTLNWQDLEDLKFLDELTAQLDAPNLKKSDVKKIDDQIDGIEKSIKKRKDERNKLALKLVEWKARGNIDIRTSDGGKLEA